MPCGHDSARNPRGHRRNGTRQPVYAEARESCAEADQDSGWLRHRDMGRAIHSKAFDKLDISYPKTEKNAPSFTKAFLTTHSHDLPKAILQAREFNKSKNTFMDGLLKHVGKDGRVHGHINQIRSMTAAQYRGAYPCQTQTYSRYRLVHPETWGR